ncbi:MAG: SMC-Scp complex subunit ScpB [Candidatus Pacearchaeota archaeon]|nr:SMC-Scp complex subunit ScpB [Candidatus Pacearchaeota archaeon]
MEDEKRTEDREEEELLKKVEACLFLAARYLSIDDLVRFTGINPIMLKELLGKLEKRYEKIGGSIIVLRREAEGGELWKMDVRPEFSFLVNKLATGESEFTKAEQETLAIIAYKQPIKQSIVVKIRGNKAYDHIKHFITNNLITAKKTGRTFELKTSDKFYDYFNLKKEDGKVHVEEIAREKNEFSKTDSGH